MPAKIRWWRDGFRRRYLRVDNHDVAVIEKMDGYWQLCVLGRALSESPVREKDARRLAEKHACRITREISKTLHDAILEAEVK